MFKLHISKESVIIFLVQVMIGLFILFVPSLLYYFSRGTFMDWQWNMFMILWFGPCLAFYFINFYLLIPILYQKRRWVYMVVNVLLLALANLPHYMVDFSEWPVEQRVGYSSFLTSCLLLEIFGIIAALSVRYIMRRHRLEMELKEEKQRNAEAELAWLKNQLNPHFLFNTLNNISALVQIDADMAQDGIAKLSDLLRYALYETGKQEVLLTEEEDFIANYIDLMKMRLGPGTQVTYHSDVKGSHAMIAPLLFLSPIENAFKHGASTTEQSSVEISLSVADGRISFRCSNTNLAKGKKDQSGSGIGYQNMQRRLQLIYPDRHHLSQSVVGNKYSLEIEIW